MTHTSIAEGKPPSGWIRGVLLTHGWAIAATTSWSLSFVVAVYLIAWYAGPIVDSLDKQVGEVQWIRGKTLAEAGLVDEAIAKYREALAVTFDSPLHQVYAMRELAGLLLDQKRYDEAIDVARACSELDAEDGAIFGAWHKALRDQGKKEEALALTRHWSDWAQKKGLSVSMAWAKFYEGIDQKDLGDRGKALESFQAGLRIHLDGRVGEALAAQVSSLQAGESP